MPKSKKKWVLIWWLETHDSNVIELNRVKKADRSVGCITTLKWQDEKNNTSLHNGKIISISENRDDLEKIFLADDGTIKDSSTKLFSSATINDQKERCQQEKLIQTIKKLNQRQFATQMLRDSPMFSADGVPLTKKSRKVVTEGKNNQNKSQRSASTSKNYQAQKAKKSQSASATMSSTCQYPPPWSQMSEPSQPPPPQVLRERFIQKSSSTLDAHPKHNFSTHEKRNGKHKRSHHSPVQYCQQNFKNYTTTMTTAPNFGYQDSCSYAGNQRDQGSWKNWPPQGGNMAGVQDQGGSRYDDSQNQGNPGWSGPRVPLREDRPPSIPPSPSLNHPMNPNFYPSSQTSSSGNQQFPSMEYYSLQYSQPQQVERSEKNYCDYRPRGAGFPGIGDSDEEQNKVLTELQTAPNTSYSIDEYTRSITSTTLPSNAPQSSVVEDHSHPGQIQSLTQGKDIESSKEMGFGRSMTDKISENIGKQAKDKDENKQLQEKGDQPENPTLVNPVQPLNTENFESSSSQESSDITKSDSDGERYANMSDDESLKNSDCVETSGENIKRAAQGLAKYLPFPIPEECITYQKILLEAMTYNCKKARGPEVKNRFTLPPLPEEFYKPGDVKVEIAERCGFYMKQNIVNYVEMMTQDAGSFDWRSAVTIVLNEVYKGEYSLADYCALGSRDGGRPGICKRLFAGLYKWICKLAGEGEVIERKQYIKCINKAAGNKRK